MGIAQAAGLFHSLILYRQGLLDLGGVVAYFGLLQLFGFPTFTSLFAYSQVSLGVAGARRILELINRENNLDQNILGQRGGMRGEVEFRQVTFAYDDGEAVLENISFKVKPGQTVAIVGQTGSGKTSLVKLINRTYDVTGGQVLVDGVDVRRWNLEVLAAGHIHHRTRYLLVFPYPLRTISLLDVREPARKRCGLRRKRPRRTISSPVLPKVIKP